MQQQTMKKDGIPTPRACMWLNKKKKKQEKLKTLNSYIIETKRENKTYSITPTSIWIPHLTGSQLNVLCVVWPVTSSWYLYTTVRSAVWVIVRV